MALFFSKQFLNYSMYICILCAWKVAQNVLLQGCT